LFPSGNYLLLAIAMILLVVIATPLIVVLIAERAGLTTRGAFQAGLLLAQTSEFSIVIGIVGFEAGHIDQELLSVIALITVLTMILTPFLATDSVSWKLTRLRPFVHFSPIQDIPRNHILILGCGRSVQTLVSSLEDSLKRQIVVIDYDPGALRRIESAGVRYVRGDAADIRVLDLCNAKYARLVISTLNNMRDNQNIIRYLENTEVVVRVLEDHDASLVKNAGGTPVLSSLLASQKTLQWIKDSIPEDNSA
jgi:CPA2 family monovalent cation:H+ antiporter-2